MNLKSFSIASLMLAAGLTLTVESSGLNPAAFKETSQGSSLEFGRVKPNPGFSRKQSGQLKWRHPGSMNDLSLASNANLVRYNPNLPYAQPRITGKVTPKKSASAASGKVIIDMPVLMGCVGYADSWTITGEGKVGIYEIGSHSLEEVTLQPDMLTSYGQVYAGTKYFATQPEMYGSWVVDMKYNIFDTRSWSQNTVSGNYNFNARAMTFDPVSRRAYAITFDDYAYTYHFTVMDMDSYSYKVISKVGTDDWSALMCDGKGMVYGMKRDGLLVKFNKASGEYTEIGQTGLKSTKMTCGAIDPATGRCFYIYYTEANSDMYEIDLSNASATYLYAVPENAQVLSLFVPEAEVAAGAPAKPESLAAAFEGTSFTGTLAFSVPETTTDGSSLSGSVTYTVMVNGERVASGEAKPGDAVECPVEVSASGEYTFSVSLANAAGEGEVAAVTQWIGYPAPAAPKKVTLSCEGGVGTLTWDPVTVKDAEEDSISYTVVSYPSGKTVAEGLKDTAFSMPLPEEDELTKYSFGVVAVYGDSRSEEAISNSYVVGYLPLPYQEDFEDSSCMDLYKIVDANGDGGSWTYNFFGEGRIMIDYSYSMPHDDYAVLHPVRMESGNMYTIECEARGTSYYTEKFEIVVAKGNDVESLKAGEVILPAVTIASESYAAYSAKFIPEESGVYYVAIHCVSDSYQNKLYIDNLYVSNGISTLAPGAVTYVDAYPDASGALSAEISFFAPEVGMDGNALTELSYVVIERDGKEIGRVEGQPGTKLFFTDDSPVNGMNYYTIAAYNSYGRGLEAYAEVYVGVVEPDLAEDVTVRYGSNTGEAVVTWVAPTHDVAGHIIDSSTLTYNVLRSVNGAGLHEVASGLTETSYTEQALEADADQQFVCYFIETVGTGGISERAMSNFYPLGRPESVPAKESFGGRTTDYEWGAEASEYSFAAWDIYPANELPFASYDGGSVAAAIAAYQSPENDATLISSLFDLSSLENPVLSFYLFDYTESANGLNVYVDNGVTRTLAGEIEFGEVDMDWKRKSVDLSAFKGQTVCILLEAQIIDINLVAIDNLRITEDVDHNLAAISISAPESAEPNQEFTVAALIENAGKQTADSYSVKLLRDGEAIQTVEGKDLAPEATAEVEFNVSLSVMSSAAPVFSVAVDYQLDEVEADNVSDEASVSFIASPYPAPENFGADVFMDSVDLFWDEPNLNNMVLTPSVDDVEAYTPFSTGLPTSVVEGDNIGQWTTIDADGLPTYTSTFDYPGVGDPMAFVVYNAFMQEDNVFACHSGHQMFLSLASKPDDAGNGNDDWLISPELAGRAQTISFYAKSIDTYGVDDFQVLYSTSGKEISDFTPAAAFESTGDWKEYKVDLPEGARYFAVRCISYDKYAFLLDDFRMIKATDMVTDLTIEGYNVYCDGKRVNDSLIKDNVFTHSPEYKPECVYYYNVTCVYNLGESCPSETLEVLMYGSGVESAVTGSVKVTAGVGRIAISGLCGETVSISDSFGHSVCNRRATGSLAVEVPSGIYIVKAGSSIVKVIVR